MVSSGAGRRGTGGTPFLLLAAFVTLPVLSGALAAWSLRQEYATRVAERLLEDQTTILAVDGAPQLEVPRPPARFASARLLLADALYLARVASQTSDRQQRDMLLARAHGEVTAALMQRPHWGEGWVTAAYVASLRQPSAENLEREALVRSYSDAPYLHKTGFWRVERALGKWNELPPGTRGKVVDETAWLLRYGDLQNRAQLFALARQSPAYRPIFLRWREL